MKDPQGPKAKTRRMYNTGGFVAAEKPAAGQQISITIVNDESPKTVYIRLFD
jgi:hypothetical protein